MKAPALRRQKTDNMGKQIKLWDILQIKDPDGGEEWLDFCTIKEESDIPWAKLWLDGRHPQQINPNTGKRSEFRIQPR